MTNRRDFLAIGATTLAAASMIRAPFAADLSTAWARPSRVIFDERFVDARLFARQAARLGTTLAAMRGDVADLWYDELRPLCAQGAVALAGLTTRSALFCIEQLASNHWMRVRFRADHVANGPVLEHHLLGPEHMLGLAATRLKDNSDWHTQMANLVTRCPLEAATRAQCTLITRAERTEMPEESLVSWLITAR